MYLFNDSLHLHREVLNIYTYESTEKRLNSLEIHYNIIGDMKTSYK